MKFLLAISRGIDASTTLLGRLTWWASLLLVLVGFQNVVARYGYQQIRRLFGDQVAAALSNNTYLEAQTLLYNIIFLIGAAYVLRVDAHVRVDILFSRMKARTKAWIDIGGILLFLFPFAWMGVFFGNTYVSRSWSQLEISPNPGGLARYPIKTLIIVVPLLAPIALAFFGHGQMVWFGVLIAMNLQASFLTPPFGFALFYLKGVSPPSIKTHHIYRGVVPFIAIQLVMVVVIATFPGLVTWLPELARAAR